MAIQTAVGTVTIGASPATTAHITGLSFQPDGIIFIGAKQGTTTGSLFSAGDASISMGAYDGTSAVVVASALNHNNTKHETAGAIFTGICLAHVTPASGASGDALDYYLTPTGMTSDGCNVTITANPSSDQVYYYIAFAGIDFEVGTYTTPTSGSTKDIPVAFEPSALMVWGLPRTGVGILRDMKLMCGVSDGTTHYITSVFSNDNFNPTDSWRGQTSGYIDRPLNFSGGFAGSPTANAVAFDADGATLTYNSVGGSALLRAYLAFGGCQAKVDTVTQYTGGATGTTSNNGGTLGFDVEMLLTQTFQRSASGSVHDDARFSFGFSDGSDHRAVAFADEHDETPADVGRARSDEAATVIVFYDGTNDGKASVDLTTTERVEFDWTDSDLNGREIVILALADAAASGTTVTPSADAWTWADGSLTVSQSIDTTVTLSAEALTWAEPGLTVTHVPGAIVTLSADSMTIQGGTLGITGTAGERANRGSLSQAEREAKRTRERLRRQQYRQQDDEEALALIARFLTRRE